LLQQANLNAPSSSPTGPTTNHITAPAAIPSLSYHNTQWLIHSGANEHICCNISCFSSFYKIKSVRISLQNGQSIIVSHAGNVSFTSHFYLTNVLYSPVFHLNLISVAKLFRLTRVSSFVFVEKMKNLQELVNEANKKVAAKKWRKVVPSVDQLMASSSTDSTSSLVVDLDEGDRSEERVQESGKRWRVETPSKELVTPIKASPFCSESGDFL